MYSLFFLLFHGTLKFIFIMIFTFLIKTKCGFLIFLFLKLFLQFGRIEIIDSQLLICFHIFTGEIIVILQFLNFIFILYLFFQIFLILNQVTFIFFFVRCFWILYDFQTLSLYFLDLNNLINIFDCLFIKFYQFFATFRINLFILIFLYLSTLLLFQQIGYTNHT